MKTPGRWRAILHCSHLVRILAKKASKWHHTMTSHDIIYLLMSKSAKAICQKLKNHGFLFFFFQQKKIDWKNWWNLKKYFIIWFHITRVQGGSTGGAKGAMPPPPPGGREVPQLIEGSDTYQPEVKRGPIFLDPPLPVYRIYQLSFTLYCHDPATHKHVPREWPRECATVTERPINSIITPFHFSKWKSEYLIYPSSLSPNSKVNHLWIGSNRMDVKCKTLPAWQASIL